jgi:hypothetical protein
MQEYPRERAVSVFVDGHLHIESAQTWQQPQDLGYEQLERKEHPVVGEVEREAP